MRVGNACRLLGHVSPVNAGICLLLLQVLLNTTLGIRARDIIQFKQVLQDTPGRRLTILDHILVPHKVDRIVLLHLIDRVFKDGFEILFKALDLDADPPVPPVRVVSMEFPVRLLRVVHRVEETGKAYEHVKRVSYAANDLVADVL